MWQFLRNHGTKVIGFAQVTLAAMSTVDGMFSTKVLKMILLASGILTAWRGYFNSSQGSQS